MNYLTNPIVKASLALSLSILLLLGVGFGSVHYYKKGEAQRNKTAVAQLETKVIAWSLAFFSIWEVRFSAGGKKSCFAVLGIVRT